MRARLEWQVSCKGHESWARMANVLQTGSDLRDALMAAPVAYVREQVWMAGCLGHRRPDLWTS